MLRGPQPAPTDDPDGDAPGIGSDRGLGRPAPFGLSRAAFCGPAPDARRAPVHRAAERSRRHSSRAPHRGFRDADGVAGAPGLEVEGVEREEASWPSGGGGARMMERLLLRVRPPLRTLGESGPLLPPDPPGP